MGLAEEYEEARAEEVKDRLILDNKNRKIKDIGLGYAAWLVQEQNNFR